MKAAVIGLGVEGKKASKSLINHGWEVYATDLKTDIDLEELEIGIMDIDITADIDKISIRDEKIFMDLGYSDEDMINDCDAVVLSPSLWNSKIANDIQLSGKLICDILTKHRKTFTIAVTGTNGKTTTSTMIKEILENAGKKVLIGGNAGGGFQGYCEIFLEAENKDYDVIIVEVCDMTLNFCKYCFDFDLIALTNIGNDHINVHGSLNNYKNSLSEFFKNKDIIIDENEENFSEFEKNAKKTLKYTKYPETIKLFGDFNKLNAGLASKIANYLDIDENIVENTLKNFEAIEGRLKKFKLFDSNIYIGKTDNSDAVKSILNEQLFYAVFIGTPRYHEEYRLDILNEVSKSNPEVIVLFPGLENTIDLCLERLNSLSYEGRIEIAYDIDEIVTFIAEYSHEDAMFIGGNGQDMIIEIQSRLKLLCEKCN